MNIWAEGLEMEKMRVTQELNKDKPEDKSLLTGEETQATTA
jgi:hypothetical protein